MAFTQEDLQSAAAKLATLDFTAAELEAIATTIRGHGAADNGAVGEDDVTGFGVFEPNDEPVWTKGFIPAVAGLMRQPGKGFTAPGDVAGIISMEEGETI